MGLLLEHPTWLAAITTTLIGVATLLIIALVRVRRRAERLLGDRMAARATSGRRDAVLFVALCVIGVALIGPRLGHREISKSTAGADVVILLDVSQSMDAADTPPSRLVRARAMAAGLLARLHAGSRVALAAFAGRGVLFTPLTHDHDAIAHMLPALDTRLIRPGGTNLESGIASATRAFEPGSDRPRVLVVVSDGELNRPEHSFGRVAAERADVRVVAVALGSERGARVPDHGAPLQDSAGAIVVSRRQTSALEALTTGTGGALLIADAWGEVDLTELAAEVEREIGGGTLEGVPHRIRVALIWPFATLAALLLWLEALPRRRGRRSEASTNGATARAAIPLLLVALLGADRTVPEAPGVVSDDALAYFEEGLLRADAGEQGRAERAFSVVSVIADEPELAALALHNLGVLALKQGRLERARDVYFDAIVLLPNDRQIRFNLEWTLLALEQQSRADADALEQRAQSEEPDESGSEPGQRDPTEGLTAEHEVAESEPEPVRASGRDERQADPSAGAQGVEGEAQGRTPSLAPEERSRWLRRVKDDPGRAMKLIAHRERADLLERPKRGEATW